jgi:hypothetical protein
MQMRVLKTYTYRCQEGDLLKAFLLLYPNDMMRAAHVKTPGFTGRQSGFAASAPKPPPPPARAYVPLGAGAPTKARSRRARRLWTSGSSRRACSGPRACCLASIIVIKLYNIAL